jgi:hypothetical protein
MARKPDGAPAQSAALTTTIALTRPLRMADAEITELKLVEPELRHFVASGRRASANEQTAALIAALSGISEEAAVRLKLRDAKRIQRWFEELRRDALAPGGPGASDEDVDDGRRFVLVAPIASGGDNIMSTLTLREPDLGSGVAVEKFKSEMEQTAALLAALSGLTIPAVMGLRLRDLARMEAWVYPLLDAPASTAAGG